MPLTLANDGPLAILTLRHGDLNLFDREVMGDLAAVAARLTADTPRALLIRAEGRVVSAGVDVGVFDDLSPDAAAVMWSRLIVAIRQLEDLRCPTVFAAHGLCLTAAFEVALACDLLVAARSARFGLVENVIGLTPSMGGTQRLTERAGPARAKQLIYTGRRFDAETLYAWNVVSEVVDDDAVDDVARDLARELAHGPTCAHAVTKTLVHTQLEHGTRAADDVVPELSGELFATADLRGGVRSFLANGPGRATFAGH